MVMGNTKTDALLYLDFDGVLHDADVYTSPTRGIYMNTPNRRLFEWMPILECLLAPYSDIGIVLSTSWTLSIGQDEALKYLSPELQRRVVGITYDSKEMSKLDFAGNYRGVQVVCDVFRRKPTRWIAIDDDAEGWPKQFDAHLIQTNPRLGLNCPVVQERISAWLD